MINADLHMHSSIEQILSKIHPKIRFILRARDYYIIVQFEFVFISIVSWIRFSKSEYFRMYYRIKRIKIIAIDNSNMNWLRKLESQYFIIVCCVNYVEAVVSYHCILNQTIEDHFDLLSFAEAVNKQPCILILYPEPDENKLS